MEKTKNAVKFVIFLLNGLDYFVPVVVTDLGITPEFKNIK
jgi:hypothetical protein